MRTEWIAALLSLTLGLPAAVEAGDASAPRSPLSVRIVEPPPLERGSHASLRVEVVLAEDIAGPLLLTPHVEGAPVEVVRGRLLRGDATDPKSSTLAFDLPVRVVAPGTAVLHVAVSGYACGGRCRRVEASAQRILSVSL